MNIRHTRAPTALLAKYQAARSWPYLADWQAQRLPPAIDIDGPTVQTIVVAITPNQSSGEIGLHFLQRLQREQALLTQHQHAPFVEVARALSADGSGDGDVFIDIWRRQIYEWLPSATSESRFKRLRRVQQISRTDVGLLWNCMQLDDQRMQIMPSWDDAQLAPAEVEALLGQLLELTEFIASSAA